MHEVRFKEDEHADDVAATVELLVKQYAAANQCLDVRACCLSPLATEDSGGRVVVGAAAAARQDGNELLALGSSNRRGTPTS